MYDLLKFLFERPQFASQMKPKQCLIHQLSYHLECQHLCSSFGLPTLFLVIREVSLSSFLLTVLLTQHQLIQNHTNYENGIIVPIKDSNKISQAVIKVLNDTHLRNKIGLNAHKFALEFFSLDKIVKQYIEFYNK